MARNVTIKNLDEVLAARARLPAVFKPQKTDRGWRMPKYSARARARLRKQTIMAGKPWPYDIPKKEVVKEVMFKGRRRDMVRVHRKAQIERCMKRMPKLIEEYRKELAKRKAKTGLAEILSTPASLSTASYVTGKKKKK